MTQYIVAARWMLHEQGRNNRCSNDLRWEKKTFKLTAGFCVELQIYCVVLDNGSRATLFDVHSFIPLLSVVKPPVMKPTTD